MKSSLPTAVSAGQVAATLPGHATWLLQLPGLTVLTDRVFARCVRPWGLFGPPRARPPALALAELPWPDVVLSVTITPNILISQLCGNSPSGTGRWWCSVGVEGVALEARGVTPVVEFEWRRQA